MIAEGVHGVQRRHEAGQRGRARVRVQVRYGLDARLAGLHRRGADPPASTTTTRMTFAMVCTPVLRELRAPHQPRRGGPRQGVDDQQRSRRTTGASSPPSAFYSASCGPSRASSCSWDRSSGSAPSGTKATSLEWWVDGLWGHLRPPAHVQEPQRAVPRTPGALEAGLRSGGLPLDQRRRRRREHVLLAPLRRRRPADRLRRNFSVPGRSTGSACRGRYLEEIFNSDDASFDGTGSFGNLGAVTAVDEPWNGFPASASIVITPLGAVFFRYEDTEASGGRGRYLLPRLPRPRRRTVPRSPTARTPESADSPDSTDSPDSPDSPPSADSPA